MKKGYTAPKAEKMEFNYSEAVVASNGDGCKNETHYTNTAAEGDPCTSQTNYHSKSDVA